jgi:hypothetical protein
MRCAPERLGLIGPRPPDSHSRPARSTLSTRRSARSGASCVTNSTTRSVPADAPRGIGLLFRPADWVINRGGPVGKINTSSGGVSRVSMTALRISGPFHGTSGYDHHVREFVRELDRQGVAVQLIDLPEWGAAKLRAELQDP